MNDSLEKNLINPNERTNSLNRHDKVLCMFQMPIFKFANLKSQTRDPQLKVPPWGLVLRIFTSWKNPSTSAGFEPANLGSGGEHVSPRHYSLMIEKDIYDCRNLSVKLPCVYVCLSSRDLFIFSARVVSFFSYFCSFIGLRSVKTFSSTVNTVFYEMD